MGRVEMKGHAHIVGLGLAGSLVAWRLHNLGWRLTAYEAGLPGAASAVAPGLLNPLAGRKLRPSPFYSSYRREMDRLYSEMEVQSGRRIWNPQPIVRFPESAEQAASVSGIQATEWIDAVYAPGHWGCFEDEPWGSVLTSDSGWVDVPEVLAIVHKVLQDEHEIIGAEAVEEDFAVDDCVIYTQGWHSCRHPLWSWLPHNPAQGEWLLIRLDADLPRQYIYNRGIWLQPVADGLWRCGARYAWEGFGSTPGPEGRKAIETRLRMWLKCGYSVEGAAAGVRPIFKDSHPVVGEHPQKAGRYILNGLGSKGGLIAPLMSACLIRCMLHREPAPAPFSVRRFWQ